MGIARIMAGPRLFHPLAALLVLLGVSSACAEEITVFAAASLKDALDEIAVRWEAETGDTATIVLAASSQLARQIEQGAPADVFISANEAWMDALEEQGRLAARSRVDLLTNELVLIAPKPDQARIDLRRGDAARAALGDGRVAMALVDAVPAGIYGKAALESLGIWNDVAPQVVQADNVRAALAFVARGEVAFGIVYATDAAAEDDVAVVGRFPEESHPPIVYPAAVIAGGHEDPGRAFLRYLRGDAARSVFEALGFGLAAD